MTEVVSGQREKKDHRPSQELPRPLQEIPGLNVLNEMPVWRKKNTLVEAVKHHETVIFVAGTGTGKTMSGSIALMREALAEGQKMIVAENLRKATDSSAQAVAGFLGVRVGDLVGVQNKYSHRLSKDTRLLFCPVQSLLLKIQKDPTLKDYGLIMIDEAHKESKQMEQCMIAIRDIQAKRKELKMPELKLVLASATLDVKKMKETFPGAALVEIPGINYPVQKIFENNDIPESKLVEAAAEKVAFVIHGQDQGNILVFLSGEGEIDIAKKYLQNCHLDADIFPFYGRLNKKEQDEAFAKSTRRKVILATNAAQESLTFKDFKIVVDTCMHKHVRLDAETGRDRLILEKAPKDHLKQRMGRLGRIKREDGGIDKYYALITEKDYNARSEHEPAEMTRTDLTSQILLLLADGYKDPYKFAFINKPKPSHIDIALFRLKKIGAVDEKNKLTEKGKMMIELQIDNVNVASMVAAAIMKYGDTARVCQLAAMMEAFDKDKFLPAQTQSAYKHLDSDLLPLVDIFKEYYELPEADRKKWTEKKGLKSGQLQDAVRLYDQLIEYAKNKQARFTLDNKGFNRSILEGFTDSLVTGKTKKTLALREMRAVPSIQIDKRSVLASAVNTPAFITAEIKADSKRGSTVIYRRHAVLNHLIPPEILNEQKKQLTLNTDMVSAVRPNEAISQRPILSPEKKPEEKKETLKKTTFWKRLTSWFSNFFKNIFG